MATDWSRIVSTGPDFCFVCDKKFKSFHKKIYIGKHKKNGEDLYRHDGRCDPLSENWKAKFHTKKHRKKIEYVTPKKQRVRI